MASICYDLLVIWDGGTERTIRHVFEYGVDGDTETFWFTKHGYRSFVPCEGVRYFGRRFDYEEGGADNG